MKDKDINTVTRVIGILGIILCIISLVTPWSSSAFTFGVFKDDYTAPFYIDYFTSQTIRDSSYFHQAVFFGIVMLTIFILIIFALVWGILCIGKVEGEIPSTFLFIASLFIVSVILYILAISIWSYNVLNLGSSYGPGFISALIGFIIFFVLFIIQSIFYKEGKPIEKISSDNETIKILKLRYAKGEITKEQFKQMKKDLED